MNLHILIFKILATKSELSGDKIDELERDLSQAKSTAQEADKRCEDVVRSAVGKENQHSF